MQLGGIFSVGRVFPDFGHFWPFLAIFGPDLVFNLLSGAFFAHFWPKIGVFDPPGGGPGPPKWGSGTPKMGVRDPPGRGPGPPREGSGDPPGRGPGTPREGSGTLPRILAGSVWGFMRSRLWVLPSVGGCGTRCVSHSAKTKTDPSETQTLAKRHYAE